VPANTAEFGGIFQLLARSLSPHLEKSQALKPTQDLIDRFDSICDLLGTAEYSPITKNISFETCETDFTTARHDCFLNRRMRNSRKLISTAYRSSIPCPNSAGLNFVENSL
jgi:hypothetical protein